MKDGQINLEALEKLVVEINRPMESRIIKNSDANRDQILQAVDGLKKSQETVSTEQTATKGRLDRHEERLETLEEKTGLA